jgi:cytoskeletal protein RodZ
MGSDDGQHSRGRKQHRVLKVVLGVVALLVLLALVGAVRGSDNSGGSNSSTSSSSDTSASNSTAAAASATPGINQPADDGKFQFTVTSFACGQSQLSNDNEFETATAQGQFCVLKLDIKNIGTEAQQFDDSAQYVYTSDGKQLSYASDGTTAANSSDSQCRLIPTINPGNSLDCNVAFDVPKGVTPTYAMLHDSSLSDGVKVNLQ